MKLRLREGTGREMTSARTECIELIDHATGWTEEQREHLRRLMAEGATLAYWCSDAHGRPANHALDPMSARDWTARPGLVQEVAGPLQICTEHALHATNEPHRWAGVRVWLVGLVGEIVRESSGTKLAALRREIVGEILPECAFSASVGVRIGRKDLDGARLDGASLDGASLAGANLARADLAGANLANANLANANLANANLADADLARADDVCDCEDCEHCEDCEDCADPGGLNALLLLPEQGRRARHVATPVNPRDLPCPTCGAQNALTPADAARGYQCDRCADRDEGYGP